VTDAQDASSGKPTDIPAESDLFGAPPSGRPRHLSEPGVPVAPHDVVDEPGGPGEPGEPNRDRLLRLLLGRRVLALGRTRVDRWVDWVGTLVIVVLAAVIRLQNLGRPASLVFDETYYVKDAFTLGRLGFEARWPDDPNAAFEAGHVDTFFDQAAYVVHPQVGKWLISWGMDVGGGPGSSVAWRLANAVIGILAVLLLIRGARRLFSSTPMGLVAGLLFAVDGTAIVHSRIALLDQFVMFFGLLAFWFLLLDREQARRRLADRLAAVLDAGGRVTRSGPGLGFRWWRLAAGVSLGLATGVKWSGLYFVAGFGLLTVLWDVTARRQAGIRGWLRGGVVRDGLPAFAQIVPTALVVYVASWWSWFATPGAYLRQWAAQNPGHGVTWLPESLRSFVHYHQQMWTFHTGLTTEHRYASNPIGWIIQWRPTSFYWNDHGDGHVQAITSIGNPLLWWLAAVAILLLAWFGVRHRDWRALAAISGTIFGWLPWVLTYLDTHRTVFTFYTIAFTPWVVLTLVYVGVVLLERTDPMTTGHITTGHDRDTRARSAVVLGITVVVTAIVVVSAAFYPLWTAQVVPIEYWRNLIRLRSWV
jgi:dolichyl-phosphate-mannose--protein O-mannosyl transferase